jgi:8-amino-7-oxononanoate synthase
MVANRIARLQGCERGTLAPSTLHLFWDLFGILAGCRIAIYLDAGAYPIARWGVERAAGRGVPVYRFPHRDARALQQLLSQRSSRIMPVVVTDGMCNVCGCIVPVAAYLDHVRAAGGLMVIDDTQALGLLGTRPDETAPFGHGGGGSLCHNNVGGPDVLVISSLAKGFGVPLAALSGSEDMVQRFEDRSETRVHCSPPSAAAIHAADRALKINADCGDGLRAKLIQRVQHFRRRLAESNLASEGGLFPTQTLQLPRSLDTRRLYQQLLDLGMRTVLRSGHSGDPRISFVVTALHRPEEIDRAVNELTTAVRIQSRGLPTGGRGDTRRLQESAGIL